MRAGRSIAAACFGALLVTAVGLVPSARAAEAEQVEYKHLAHVKVEIKQESGKVIRNAGDLLEWNKNGSVVIEADDTKHNVGLTLSRANEKSRDLKITLAYTRDGEAIIAPYKVDAKVKKREVIRIEGGLAIAVTVTPKKVKVDPPPKKEEREKIDGEAENPLDGLESVR